MPMFTATAADGSVVRYENLWQQKNLLLVILSDDDPTADAYAASLKGIESTLDADDAILVVTKTRLTEIASTGVVVADRWGEVYYVQESERAAQLPAVDELIDWLRFVRNECPECQGEAW
jgi:hypothetical protein